MGAVPVLAVVMGAGLWIDVRPEVGTLDDLFTITLHNDTGQPIPYDPCFLPSITALASGNDVSCPPPPPDPGLCELAVLAAGDSLRREWRPRQTICDPRYPAPGIHEVRWTGPELGGAFPGRMELLPSPQLDLEVRLEPATARMGEPVKVTVKNTSGKTLAYDRCCFPPTVIDPRGRASLCIACIECTQIVDFWPDEELSFTWTPGKDLCDDAGDLPGRYRVVWGGFWTERPGAGEQYFGEAEAMVMPPAERRLDLALSAQRAQVGDTITLTATNPLAVSVWRAVCCDEPIFIDALGRESPCGGCPLDCAPVRGQEIVPGGKVSTEAQVRLEGSWGQGCGLRPGRWTVIWGPSFGLQPGGDPVPPVHGLAELEVVEGHVDPTFIRGDCDRSNALDITDPIASLDYMFLGGTAPPCLDACDADDTNSLELTDAVVVLTFLFLGGIPPAAPFPLPGVDPTPGGPGCAGP